MASQDLYEVLVAAVPEPHWEEVEPNLDFATRELARIERHLAAAKSIMSTDPLGSFQLIYDATRKSLQALLATTGIRINAAGGHFAFVRVAESGCFKSAAFLEFREMRIIRNTAEYPTPDSEEPTPEYVLETYGIAEAIYSEIKGMIISPTD